jgi:ferritin-like metal-binding protein YciE
MAVRSAAEFLGMELAHIENAEMQAKQALQRMAGEAGDDKLRQKLEQRLRQGERVLQRVRGGLEKLDGNIPSGTQNTAARGLIEEIEGTVREIHVPELKPAAIIGGVQKLEHYCIAAWGTAKAPAAGMGHNELAKAMAEAVEEGYRLDEDLTWLAENRINPKAIEVGSGEDAGRERRHSSDRSDGGHSDGGQSDEARSARPENSASRRSSASGGGSDDLKSRE